MHRLPQNRRQQVPLALDPILAIIRSCPSSLDASLPPHSSSLLSFSALPSARHPGMSHCWFLRERNANAHTLARRNHFNQTHAEATRQKPAKPNTASRLLFTKHQNQFVALHATRRTDFAATSDGKRLAPGALELGH
jgi:hypothetical protein